MIRDVPTAHRQGDRPVPHSGSRRRELVEKAAEAFRGPVVDERE
jgi:hypothetical protein